MGINRLSRRGLLMALTLALALSGCGRKEPSQNAVRGRVFYRGNPLNGGLIVFVPDSERGNDGPLVKGTIKDDGTFTLNAENPLTVTPGWYRVAVAPRPSDASSVPTTSNLYPSPPSRYRNPQISGLSGQVKPGVDNVFEFDLDDKATVSQ